MRILGLLFFLSFFSSSIFAQQFLWSTVQQDSAYVPMKYVTYEVLKFYDHYELHYDLSGFSKKRFMDEIDYGFDGWEWLNEINEQTVYALKSNTGNGSIVLVMFVSKENVNLIIFTNNMIDGNFNFLSNLDSEKFETWLKTLMN